MAADFRPWKLVKRRVYASSSFLTYRITNRKIGEAKIVTNFRWIQPFKAVFWSSDWRTGEFSQKKPAQISWIREIFWSLWSNFLASPLALMAQPPTVCPWVHRNSVAHLFPLIWWHIQNLNASPNSAHVWIYFSVCDARILAQLMWRI